MKKRKYRRIRVYGSYFYNFLESIPQKEQNVLKAKIAMIEDSKEIPTKLIKYLENGLWEIKVRFNKNSLRIFFIFDGDKVIILFNGFSKKSQKTPKKELKKAFKLKEEYENNK